MRKIFTLLFGIISASFFCQAYHFDHLLKFDSKLQNKSSYVEYKLINSQNKNISIEIGRNIEGGYFALLRDFDNKIFHRLHLDDINSSSLNFTYVESWHIRNIKSFYKYDKIEIRKTDDLRYKIVSTKNNKIGKKGFEMEIEVQPFILDAIAVDYEPLSSNEEDKINHLLKNQIDSGENEKKYIIKSIWVKKNYVGADLKRIFVEEKKTDVSILIDKSIIKLIHY